jgi:dihydropteroate synthase
MGVVNVTPNSFSESTRHPDPARAAEYALQLVRDGADIVDVGGEATNPWAEPVSLSEELRRVVPVVERLVAAGVTVSVDTTKAEVARSAVVAGAQYINDVSGGLFDPDMASAIGGATYICGHLRGRHLGEVFAEERKSLRWTDVAQELSSRLDRLSADTRARAWVDPGVGFGKGAAAQTNLDLLAHAGDLGRSVGCPVVVGPSRKRFIRALVGKSNPSDFELDQESVRVSVAAVRAGARMIRIHNVALLRAALNASS